ncbi:MAG: hypothetical protein J6M02_07110 [Clostridia bacterium]|nr:hypothetical protein [Clostridia bacterium]
MNQENYAVGKSPFWMEYFELINATKRNLVADWFSKQTGKTWRQNKFLKSVKKALEKVDYDYAIPKIEASIDENGNIYYHKGHDVCRGLAPIEWEDKAKAFAPEYQSEPGTIYELYLWYAWRIAMGYWSLEYVCDDSSGDGNYDNSPDATHDIEPSGAKNVGGAADGVGNTFKAVYDDAGYVLCGGNCHIGGMVDPVAATNWYGASHDKNSYAAWVLVLRKPF